MRVDRLPRYMGSMMNVSVSMVQSMFGVIALKFSTTSLWLQSLIIKSFVFMEDYLLQYKLLTRLELLIENKRFHTMELCVT